jgi:hypothetical protein
MRAVDAICIGVGAYVMRGFGQVAPTAPIEAAIASGVEVTLPGIAQIEPKLSIDSVLLAAADAADISPRATKAAVVAAFVRARELGLSVEAVVKGLGEGEVLGPPR